MYWACKVHRSKVIPDIMSFFGGTEWAFQNLMSLDIQPADIGWPTGIRRKLSCCQAQLSQETCLAVA